MSRGNEKIVCSNQIRKFLELPSDLPFSDSVTKTGTEVIDSSITGLTFFKNSEGKFQNMM